MDLTSQNYYFPCFDITLSLGLVLNICREKGVLNYMVFNEVIMMNL